MASASRECYQQCSQEALREFTMEETLEGDNAYEALGHPKIRRYSQVLCCMTASIILLAERFYTMVCLSSVPDSVSRIRFCEQPRVELFVASRIGVPCFSMFLLGPLFCFLLRCSFCLFCRAEVFFRCSLASGRGTWQAASEEGFLPVNNHQLSDDYQFFRNRFGSNHYSRQGFSALVLASKSSCEHT